MEKTRLQRFFKAKDHKESIKGITDSIAVQLHQFTVHIVFLPLIRPLLMYFQFYGNISIEKSMERILK
jgi:hypothetical protein